MSLENEFDRKQLSQQLKTDIDNWCADHFDDGPRSHLGASEIGNSCSRFLWYKFRWLFHKHHDGRQQRLFQRGHFEEPRFISYLEGIGCEVQQFAKALWWHPESDAYFIADVNFKESYTDIDSHHYEDVTNLPLHLDLAEKQGVKFDKGKMQIRINACKGHFGGSVDALCKLPTKYNLAGDVIFLDEFKTQGVGKKGDKFAKLVQQGVKINKPVHWAQKCIYGYKLNVKYGIYISVNKNDDDLHIEVVKLDHNLGKDLERKAEMIIFSETPPSRIAESPSYYECNYCDAKELCFSNKLPLVNCRSCLNSKPIDNAEWYCKKHNSVIPKEEISKQFECWESLI